MVKTVAKISCDFRFLKKFPFFKKLLSSKRTAQTRFETRPGARLNAHQTCRNTRYFKSGCVGTIIILIHATFHILIGNVDSSLFTVVELSFNTTLVFQAIVKSRSSLSPFDTMIQFFEPSLARN